MYTFPGEELLRKEYSRILCNTEKKKDSAVTQYFSTSTFLMEYMETPEEMVWYRKKRAAIDVWVGCIEHIVLFGGFGDVRSSKTGGLFLLT